MSEWQPIETAPKGGGAEKVTDPAWVEPPRILMNFGEEGCAIVYWDWYYAEGGNGYRDGGSAWVIDQTGETANLHFSTPPDGWMPLPPRIPADSLTAALVVLARAGIPPDIQELLVYGDAMRGVPPGALSKALLAERERCARVAENFDAWPQEGADIAAAIRG